MTNKYLYLSSFLTAFIMFGVYLQTVNNTSNFTHSLIVDMTQIQYIEKQQKIVLQQQLIKKQEEEKRKQEEIVFNSAPEQPLSNQVEVNVVETKQKRTNTCVLENLNILVQSQFNKSLEIDKIYSELGKNKQEYWFSGLYSITTTGGHFTPIKKGEFLYNKINQKYIESKSITQKDSTYESVPELQDWEKLKALGVITENSSSIDWMIDNIRGGHPVIIELPMFVLYPEEAKWKKENNKTLFHAITIYKVDKENDTIYFVNTLSGKKESMSLSNIMYDKNYTLYPYTYLQSIDLEKFPQIYS